MIKAQVMRIRIIRRMTPDLASSNLELKTPVHQGKVNHNNHTAN